MARFLGVSSTQPCTRTKSNDEDLEVPFFSARHPSTFFCPGVEETLTPGGAVTTVLVAMIGTGVVALPFTFKLAGAGFGCFGLGYMSSLACLSMMCLCQSALSCRKAAFEQIGVCALGNRLSFLPHVALSLMVTGSSAAYTIIAANVLEAALPWELPRKYYIIACVLLMLPGCCARNFSSLRHVNAFCFSAFLTIAVLIITKSLMLKSRLSGEMLIQMQASVPPHNSTAVQNAVTGLVLSLPMTCTVMNGHMALPLVYGELKREWKGHIKRLLLCVSAIAFAFYLSMAWIPYSVFGQLTEPDILKQLANTYKALEGRRDPIVSFAQLLLGLTIVVKTAVMQMPLRVLVLRLVTPHRALLHIPFLPNLALTSFCLSIAALVAISVPKLDLIIQIIGATSAVALIYLFPGIFAVSLVKPTSPGIVGVAMLLVASGVLISGLALGTIIRTRMLTQ